MYPYQPQSEYDMNLARLTQIEQQGVSNTTMPEVFFISGSNPIISCSNSPMVIQFKQTKETLMNIDDYKAFLENAISNFRHSRTYKNYKSYLMELGLNRCQVYGNITSEMATIEMHHNMLTIFDIAYIITNHVINTSSEGISTFDLVYLLNKAHIEHKVQLIMLSLTPHQMYHATDQLTFSPEMCFGDWYSFLKEYRYGISKDIAYKIIYYLKEFEQHEFGPDYDILKIRSEIEEWSKFNERVEYLEYSQPYDPILSNMYPTFFNIPNTF